ncbi:MAG: glycosyl transferase family 1 [Acidobacteria bacterium]|nr:MAG: glycosyl transferase family 1 [Acidobacteriota bacterium]
MLILSHPTGNTNVRELAGALNEAQLLAEFWTSVSWRPEQGLNGVLPSSLRNELKRRSFPQIRQDQVRSHPWREFMRLLAVRLGFTSLTKHEVGPCCIDAVYRGMDRAVAARLRQLKGVQAVYAYEDGAVETFRSAKTLGITTIYELPIGYWRPYRELMEEEAAREPAWASTLPGNIDSSAKLARKDEELALADQIIVPSRFVRESLSKAGALSVPISVVPYGASRATRIKKEPRPRDAKLRVIFVGALTQRKGISYLFRAIDQVGPRVELTVIGRRVGNCRILDRALAAHRWIPSLPHPDVLREISRHDVMVFPSLFEGSALVVLEAMSVGVPVITTPNGGAPDFVSNASDAFLVPIRNVEAIVEKLEWLLEDRERLCLMARAAQSKADQYSWKRYREQIASVIQGIVSENRMSTGSACPGQTPLRAWGPC